MSIVNFLKSYPIIDRKENKKLSAVPQVHNVLCCPFCGKPLVKRGKKRLETLSEHVSNPNGTPSLKDAFYCENPDCEYGKYYCWNGGWFEGDGGEAFTNSEELRDKETDELNREKWDKYWEGFKKYYVNALNSWACKSEREEPWTIYLHPAFAFGCVRPIIEVHPIYEEDGSFVKNKYHLSYLKKNEKGKYTIWGVSKFSIFVYKLKKKYRTFKRKKNANSKKRNNELHEGRVLRHRSSAD